MGTEITHAWQADIQGSDREMEIGEDNWYCRPHTVQRSVRQNHAQTSAISHKLPVV